MTPITARTGLKRHLRSARLVRRAGQLHLVLPRAAWKRIGVEAGDIVSITCRNGRAEIRQARKRR